MICLKLVRGLNLLGYNFVCHNRVNRVGPFITFLTWGSHASAWVGRFDRRDPWYHILADNRREPIYKRDISATLYYLLPIWWYNDVPSLINKMYLIMQVVSKRSVYAILPDWETIRFRKYWNIKILPTLPKRTSQHLHVSVPTSFRISSK